MQNRRQSSSLDGSKTFEITSSEPTTTNGLDTTMNGNTNNIVLQHLADDEAEYGTFHQFDLQESSIGDDAIRGDTMASDSSTSSDFGRYNWRLFIPEKKSLGNLCRWLVVGGAAKVSTRMLSDSLEMRNRVRSLIIHFASIILGQASR